MPIHPRDMAALWDIAEAARRTRRFVEGMDPAAFEGDEKTHFAVIAQLQIIGEATKRLSDTTLDAHPAIPWSKMARMPDWLIHHYDQIRLDILWETAVTDIPDLLRKLEPLLPEAP